MNKEVHTLLSYVKCEINADNFSKPCHIDNTIPISSVKSLKKEYVIERAARENIEHVNIASSTLTDSIEIKEENMKVETVDTLSEDNNSIVKPSPSKILEFVAIQDVKIEEVKEYVKKEDILDPIFVNEDTNAVPAPSTKSTSQTCSIANTLEDETVADNDSRGSGVWQPSNNPCHLAQNPITCKLCSRTFKYPRCLEKHLITHKHEKVLKCTSCDQTFKLAYSLTMHMRTHSEEKPFICSQCGKKFRHSTSLTEHSRIHTGERPYRCTHCDKAFRVLSHLNDHIKIHTGEKLFECRQCNKTFSRATILTNHMSVHSGERPYACSVCNKSFRKLSYLTDHMRDHTGDKPYACSQCNKSFSRAANCVRHMTVHTGVKPHKCSQCGKEFNISTSLTRHMKLHTCQNQTMIKHS